MQEEKNIVVRHFNDDEADDDMILRMLRFLEQEEEVDNVKKLRLMPVPNNS